MLSPNIVLQYIKDNLGWDFTPLELTDEQITNYFTVHTVATFSHYYPQKWKVPVNLNLDANKVPGIANEFYIFDPQGLEIVSVINFYSSKGELYIHGHPPLGPLSQGELPEWALAVHNAMTIKMFSSFDYTFEFNQV